MNAAHLARLAVAPELVVVDVVDHALAGLVVALCVEHPTLDDRDHLHPPLTLRRARAVARAAERLRVELGRYRDAVDAVVGKPTEDEGLPF